MWKSGNLEIWKSRVPGEISIRDGEQVERMFAAVSGDVAWIFHDGVTYRIEPPSAARRGHATHGSLTSPMPATVVSVNVAPGDRVAAGQVLIVLEAMKMELPVRAPGDGRIKAVCCKPGDLVQADVSLIEFE
jgi:acetyl/propionyl-CoA carboxylase alpha subunit